MIERLEDHFDVAVDASLREVGRTTSGSSCASTSRTRTRSSSRRSRSSSARPRSPARPASRTLYEEHLAETREHAELVEARLSALGGDPSSLKDGALRLGALNWAAFFQAHPDTPGKLAAFTFAFEHLEAAAYEQLRRVAERAGDQETASVAATILGEERAAAVRVAASFPLAAAASLDVLDVQSR